MAGPTCESLRGDRVDVTVAGGLEWVWSANVTEREQLEQAYAALTPSITHLVNPQERRRVCAWA
jgi:hypothetical protein